MPRQEYTISKRIVFTAALMTMSVLFTACGGGGSSTSPPVTATPPPSTNSAPDIRYTVSKPAILESEYFYIDAGRTDDPDGDQFTIKVTQTSGPIAATEMNTLRTDYFEYRAPNLEVYGVQEMVFDVSASDDKGNTSSVEITVAVEGFPGPGRPVGVYNPPLDLLIGNGDIGGHPDGFGSVVFASRKILTDPSGRLEVVAIAGDAITPFDYDKDDIYTVEGTYESIDYLDSFSLYASGLPDADISILSSAENKLSWGFHKLNDGPASFDIKETISVEKPCYVHGTNISMANDVVIGHRGKGLSLFDIDTGTDFTNSESFTSTLVSSAADGRSLCHFLRGIVPREYFDRDSEIYLPLTAIDFDTNELVFISVDQQSKNLKVLGSTPILTDSTKDLKIIDVFSRGSGSQAPRFLTVLLSDGEHNGDHRLVQISFDTKTGEMTQQILHSWSEGVPVALVNGQFGGIQEGGIFRTDLAVILGTSEKSFFFDNARPFDGNFSDPPIFKDPVEFSVGMGAGSAVNAIRIDGPHETESDYGVLVSFPATGEIRYFSPDDG